MGQALYRKYRSKNFSEIVGQDHITATLDQAIKTGRISHAYLLTGPRGVGKTSVARILAHAINGLDYNDDSSHLDIIEIDAASNRRIDEIRDLRDKVYVAPASAQYKVYIIDEVHMLTREAFNALLKTLEEPPAHVVFVLATTDAHKLPETIISRTQRFSFKPIEPGKVVDHLRAIAKQEKIKVEDDALALLAAHGEGSFRDSISLLDQASSNGETVTKDSVQRLLGIPPDEHIAALVEDLKDAQNLAATAGRLNELYEQGFQASVIAKQLGQAIRSSLLEDSSAIPENLLNLLAQLLEVPAAHNPERYLEIVLLKAAGSRIASIAPQSTPQTVKNPQTATPAPQPAVEKAAEPKKPAAVQKTPEPVGVKATPETEKASEPDELAPASKSTATLDESTWQQVLSVLKKKHNTLYGVVRMAQPTFKKGTVSLAFAFAFHQKRLSDSRNQQKLAEVIKEVSGQPMHIECSIDASLKGKPLASTKSAGPKSGESLSAISNIFGGGELLE